MKKNTPESKIRSQQEKAGPGFTLPAVTLPKGGGAISGIGEKFAVNAVTGTSSTSIPIFLTPSRNGFTPQLSLSYDSGNGNGSFGYGWDVSIGYISRKTNRGIPLYNDATDVFVLSGVDDLVPYLKESGGEWLPVTRTEGDYRVDAYRPRIEGLFSRIEKWQHCLTGEMHWQTTSKGNVVSIYGMSPDARIADPENAQHVFQWMIQKSYDAKGNVICYEYKSENNLGINSSLSFEGPRVKEQRSFNHLYLKSVRYGNNRPGQEDDCHFHLLFDYGEHSIEDPVFSEQQDWTVRKDPFSSFRSGFEVRQYRLCRRILLFHQFEELGALPFLVRSLNISYDENENLTLLTSAVQTGHKKLRDGTRSAKSLPPINFTYGKSSVSTDIKTVDPESAGDMLNGVDNQRFQWLDLEGEGLPGIFTEAAGEWYFKNNRGGGRFTSQQLVMEKPRPSVINRLQPVFSDIDGDGCLELVLNSDKLSGYAAHTSSGWQEFLPFESGPIITEDNPHLKYIDLNGDGLADILISEDAVFTWYPSKGKKGYGPAEYVRKALEEEKGPAIMFSDPGQSIYLADMTGDGLNDIVRIRIGEIAYWPNKGYGNFGARIIMENAPVLDFRESFEQANIRLFDVNGTGTTDLLYCTGDCIRIWYNFSGNSWSGMEQIGGFPMIDSLSTISIVDLLGKGTGCIVWSSLLPSGQQGALSYVDLMQDGKPYLLESINNNMGRVILLEYASSTEYYLNDLLSGNPWITSLSFPVQVLRKATVVDEISASRLVTSFKYHHGYFDGEEREFRGFGMVEQTDSESFDGYTVVNGLDMPPVYTKSWYHLGAYTKQGPITRQYAGEYFQGDGLAHELADSRIDNAPQLDYGQLRDACRCLKGKILRQELYAADGSEKEPVPYTVIESNFRVQQLQPPQSGSSSVFLALSAETLSYAYERNSDDPRISHSILLESDAYAQPLKTIQIAYPRRSTAVGSFIEQQQLQITAQTNSYLNAGESFYMVGVLMEQKSYELNGLLTSTNSCFGVEDLKEQLADVFAEGNVLYQHQAFTSGVQARLLSWTKNYYWADENTPLPFGELSALALLHHTEQAVMSEEWAGQVYGSLVDDEMILAAGYVRTDEHLWNPGATIHYLDGGSFYLPFKTTDVYGSPSLVYYDKYLLAVVKAENALQDTVSAEIDYRTLLIKKVTDINNNVSEAITDPLGMIIATSMYGTVNGSVKGDSPIDTYQEQGEPSIADVIENAGTYLQQATSFFYYNPGAWLDAQVPPHFVSLLREKHVSELQGEATPVQTGLGYSDGFGRALQQKASAAPDDNGNAQWLVTGRVVYNNKGKPVKQYEPFYSSRFSWESEQEIAPAGVTPIIYYDPLGRAYKTVTAKGFHSEVRFDAWQVTASDENDTVKDSLYYQQHSGGDSEEAAALKKAEAHYNTPSVLFLDSLARTFMSHHLTAQDAIPLVTRSVFDAAGNLLSVTDPRQYQANQTRPVTDQVYAFEYKYDLAGNKIYTNSMDAGATREMVDVTGKPRHSWNARDYHTSYIYDALQRPVLIEVDGNGTLQVVQRMEYGEEVPGAADKNLKGQLTRHHDQAGIVNNTLFDFSGRLLSADRVFRSEYKTEVNWEDPSLVPMEAEIFHSEIAYDALGRVIKAVQPDNSISIPAYHPSGWLKSVAVQLKGESRYQQFVESVSYNARGQRTNIVYGNGAHTSYEYEATTFRLIKLRTTRQESDGAITTLQDIRYVYDPVGNLLKITDSSFENVFTANQQVAAASEFLYDAGYQLKEATGREHRALSKTGYQQHSDVYKTGLNIHINDGSQLRSYTRAYNYDDAGNLVQIRHTGENSFTRDFRVAGTSNRAIMDEMDSLAGVDSYFDAAGNMNQLEHLRGIEWNYRNNISSVSIIEREEGNDSEYYVYDASGKRCRKVKETHDSNGGLLWKEEKIYVGSVEIRRKYQGASQTLREDRSALHVADDRERIAIVYYWQSGNPGSFPIAQNTIRYQLGNHHGSVSMVLDAAALLISYEEYFPFGDTSFTAGNSAMEVLLKEYHYTGKERDDATGLYYYGARYYAPWMGRWLNPDPIGMAGNMNLYSFLGNNPVNDVDVGGNISLKTLGIIAAVLAVGIVVGIATAGIGTALLGGGVGAVLAGTAELTIAQAVLVGAVSGAAAGVAGELTRQKLSGDLDEDGSINWRKVGVSGLTGGLGGAVGGGVAASVARASTAGTTAAITAGGISKSVQTAAISGGAGGATGEFSRQVIEGEDIDPYAIAESGLVSAVVSVGTTKTIELATSKPPVPVTKPSKDSVQKPKKVQATRDADLEELESMTKQLNSGDLKLETTVSSRKTTPAKAPTVLDPSKQYYRIGEGVRRSVASKSKGTIRAYNMETKQTFDVSIDQLVSPKTSIENDARFGRILSGVQANDNIPPIEVFPISYEKALLMTPIRDVKVTGRR